MNSKLIRSLVTIFSLICSWNIFSNDFFVYEKFHFSQFIDLDRSCLSPGDLSEETIYVGNLPNGQTAKLGEQSLEYIFLARNIDGYIEFSSNHDLFTETVKINNNQNIFEHKFFLYFNKNREKFIIINESGKAFIFDKKKQLFKNLLWHHEEIIILDAIYFNNTEKNDFSIVLLVYHKEQKKRKTYKYSFFKESFTEIEIGINFDELSKSDNPTEFICSWDEHVCFIYGLVVGFEEKSQVCYEIISFTTIPPSDYAYSGPLSELNCGKTILECSKFGLQYGMEIPMHGGHYDNYFLNSC